MNSLQQQKFCKKRKASHVEYSFVLFFFYERLLFLSQREKAGMSLSLLDWTRKKYTDIST